jgi:hypothetical protein
LWYSAPNWAGGKKIKATRSGLYFNICFDLAFDFSVDKQNNERADNRHGKAAKVETIHFAKAKQCTDPTANDCTDNP